VKLSGCAVLVAPWDLDRAPVLAAYARTRYLPLTGSATASTSIVCLCKNALSLGSRASRPLQRRSQSGGGRRWPARPARVSSVQDGFDCGIGGGLPQTLLGARAQSRGGGRWRVLS
jgi:hypothetical protein